MADEKQKQKLFAFPDSTIKAMKDGLDCLFRSCHAIFPLIISNTNGDYSVPFSRASCSSERCARKFIFASFFQSTIKKAAEIINEDATYLPEIDMALFRRLLTVIEKSQDIAQRLQKINGKKQKTAKTVQLAHHLLVPLSVYKDYSMENHTRYLIGRCDCCDEKITAEFGDNSMGNERVWHGSTDILIGKKPDCMVPVVVSISEEEERDEEEYYPISSLEHSRHQLIAETIVFGLLRHKNNQYDRNSLTPTIAISERDVKIYFYDARHDFLLESPTMPLFTDDGDDLQVGTIVALWLTINYHVTCTGLTEAVVDTGFTTDFLKNFSDEIKDLYKNKLKFGNCRMKRTHLSDRNTGIFYSSRCFDVFSKPFEKSFDCLTDQHFDVFNQRFNYLK